MGASMNSDRSAAMKHLAKQLRELDAMIEDLQRETTINMARMGVVELTVRMGDIKDLQHRRATVARQLQRLKKLDARKRSNSHE